MPFDEAELCRTLAPRIRLYGLKHLRNEAAASDLVQQVLVVVIEALRDGRVEDPANVERFAIGTCRHLVARSRRGEKRADDFARAVLPLSMNVELPSTSASDVAKISVCLAMLATRAQQVLVRSFRDEESAEQIATALGITEANVRVIRHRALAAVQRCFEGGET